MPPPAHLIRCPGSSHPSGLALIEVKHGNYLGRGLGRGGPSAPQGGARAVTEGVRLLQGEVGARDAPGRAGSRLALAHPGRRFRARSRCWTRWMGASTPSTCRGRASRPGLFTTSISTMTSTTPTSSASARSCSRGLRARPPAAVVVFQYGWPVGGYRRLARFPELGTWLEIGYRLVGEGPGYRIYAVRPDPSRSSAHPLPGPERVTELCGGGHRPVTARSGA